MSLLGPDAINSTVLSGGMSLLSPDAINSTVLYKLGTIE